jgi:hypothetical protein
MRAAFFYWTTLGQKIELVQESRDGHQGGEARFRPEVVGSIAETGSQRRAGLFAEPAVGSPQVPKNSAERLFR